MEIESAQYRENSGGQKEEIRGGEPKETILRGVQAFTAEVLDKCPQVTESGRLNYYFSGSLGVMLLLKSGKFEVIDETRLPEIVSLGEKEVSPKATEHLEGFVREIGDLDFVETKSYLEQQQAVHNSYRNGEIPEEEYKRRRKQFLSSREGRPEIAKLSETAKKTLKIRKGFVLCDDLESVTPDRVARVKIGDREVYISEPRMMLAYKTVHLGQSFENAYKTDKFVNDFNTMLKGMEAIYSREELLKVTYETMLAYIPDLPNNTFVPYHNPKFKGELLKFYNEVLALDANSAYLDQLKYGKERSIGLLKVLHNYQSPEAKQAIIDFFNQHKAQIDKWSVNSTSPKNPEVIADFLLSRPDLLQDFGIHVKEELTRDTIVEKLRAHSGELEKYGQQMTDKSGLEMIPKSSWTMDLLMKINENNIPQELQDIGELLNSGMDDWPLGRMLNAKYTSKPARRSQLLSGLKSARATLDDKDFEQFSKSLTSAIDSSYYFDPKTNDIVYPKEEERPKIIASIFEQYGVKYQKI